MTYGAGHLVTATFGQWPIWPGYKKNYYIKNCSPDGSAALFAVKQTFPISLHYLFSPEIWCCFRQVPLTFMPNLVNLGLSGQSDGGKNNFSCNFEFSENLSGINDPIANYSILVRGIRIRVKFDLPIPVVQKWW